MAYTHQNFLDDVNAGLGDRTDLVDATITRWLNMGQQRIARVHDWRELRQTSDITLSSTGTTAEDKILDIGSELGTNFRAIRNFIIEDEAESVRLESVTPDQFDELIPLPEFFSRGRPTMFTVWTKSEVLMHKVPDEDYTARIRWHKWPTDLSAVGDESELDRKDDLLLHLTLSFAFSLYRAEESSLRHFGIYQNILREAVGEDARNPDLQVVRPNFLAQGGKTMGAESWLNPFFRG